MVRSLLLWMMRAAFTCQRRGRSGLSLPASHAGHVPRSHPVRSPAPRSPRGAHGRLAVDALGPRGRESRPGGDAALHDVLLELQRIDEAALEVVRELEP